jgi:hypothetical protein
MGWIRFASLSWQSVPMPYSSGPVNLARLPLKGSAFLAFVRFPAGWSRPEPVVYQAAGEFVILEGDLRINDHHWKARSYGYVPAQHTRGITESTAGCLAWARFHGSPKPFKAAPSTDERSCEIVQVDLNTLTEGARDRSLYRSPSGETRFTPLFDMQHVPHSERSRYDALAFSDSSWWSDGTPAQSESGWINAPDGQPAIVHRTSETPR